MIDQMVASTCFVELLDGLLNSPSALRHFSKFLQLLHVLEVLWFVKNLVEKLCYLIFVKHWLAVSERLLEIVLGERVPIGKGYTDFSIFN